MLYAHTKTDEQTQQPLSPDHWQPLQDHLQAVSHLTKKFAEDFNAGQLGEILGQLHDIGKATQDFQDRLHGSRKSVDHKSEGARQAVAQYGTLGRLLAYAIYGHHGGLPDFINSHGGSGLKEALHTNSTALLCDVPILQKPSLPAPKRKANVFYPPMLIRMLYSCLVDSDYLDTEQFTQPELAALRGGGLPAEQLIGLFRPKLEELFAYPQDNPVNAARRTVLEACIAAGKGPRGFYTLTVPTGGGKTLSSMAFALEQIKTHHMSRIVYALPFTTITTQTAETFKGVFGKENVLEHHSNIENSLSDAEKEFENVRRLHSQNWDAPLIVTTNVQLLESLFSNLPSKCRKIHNLANSVIIFDEAQVLPDSLLRPTLAALASLCEDFGATVVFCTATQPALRQNWLSDLSPREIIPNVNHLFTVLHRTQVTKLPTLSDVTLAERLTEEHQALCIVNTRAHAAAIYNQMKETAGIFHLSAAMCARHRNKVLAQIKDRLNNKERCVVISTQLIEAGVDIDFPCVYRADAGLDSIAQAAGRCNREGKLRDSSGAPRLGNVYVFTPEKSNLSGWMAEMAQFGKEALKQFNNPLSPEAIDYFFQLRYWDENALDKYEILTSIKRGANQLAFPFAEIAHHYHIIKDDTKNIIIPYDEKCHSILEKARYSNHPLAFLRYLQPYMVSVYPWQFKKLQEQGFLDSALDREMPVLCISNNDNNVYSEQTGLSIEIEHTFLID